MIYYLTLDRGRFHIQEGVLSCSYGYLHQFTLSRKKKECYLVHIHIFQLHLLGVTNRGFNFNDRNPPQLFLTYGCSAYSGKEGILLGATTLYIF